MFTIYGSPVPLVAFFSFCEV